MMCVIDGRALEFRDGETILEVAQRNDIEIPTLCHDPRLDPTGACRACLVDVDGSRRLIPGCATTARPGMVVSTQNGRVKRHRATLFSMYLTDHPKGAEVCETASPCLVHRHVARFGGSSDWPSLASVRASRPNDPNRFIAFRADRCIACAACDRYCEEVEGVSAISLAYRGPATTISTVDAVSLLDSSCELCGGCIDVCPTER